MVETADSFGHGSRAQVDAILEEAVQSLPDELPFQQVDRIEYMNAQREHALSASAASAASASATATARLAKLRGEARGRRRVWAAASRASVFTPVPVS